MKFLRFALTVTLLSFSAAALAQHEHAPATNPSAPSDARKSFESLKTLAGSWEGTLTVVPPMPELADKRVKVVIRETSRGNALMHEMAMTGVPDDPITMLYLDSERLMLTHYCDAGNRPRMAGSISPDGKTVTFQMLDLSGSTELGHMANTAFTIIDANRHQEEWKFNMPGGKELTARFDLRRTGEASGPFGQ